MFRGFRGEHCVNLSLLVFFKQNYTEWILLVVVQINEISRVSGFSRVRRPNAVLRKEESDIGVTARGDDGPCGDKSVANVVFRQQVSK